MLFHTCLPSGLLIPVLTKKIQKLLLLIASEHPTLPDYPFSLRLMHRPKTNAHSSSRTAFPKAKAFQGQTRFPEGL